MNSVALINGSPDTSLAWIFFGLLFFLILVSVVGTLSSLPKKVSSPRSKGDQVRAPRVNIAQTASSSLRKLKPGTRKKMK